MPTAELGTTSTIRRSSKLRKFTLRGILFLALGIFALYYVAPMYVMIVTSLKTMEEIRQGNLLTLPSQIIWDAWWIAWNGRGYEAGDVFLRPFFWNSMRMEIMFYFLLILKPIHLRLCIQQHMRLLIVHTY